MVDRSYNSLVITVLFAAVSFISQAQTSATWQYVNNTNAKGSLDGVSFTVTGIYDGGLYSGSNYSGSGFEAGPLSSNETAISFDENSVWTVNFNSTIPTLWLYVKSFRNSTKTFSKSFRLLSSYKASKSGSTKLVTTQFGSAILEFTNVSSLSVLYQTGGTSAIGFQLVVPTNWPLPIALNTFEAVRDGSSIRLNWVTETESNNDYFVVEKRNAEGNFQEILRQKGASESNEKLEYTAYDNSPVNGINYYRLKQVDINGNSSISEVRSVKIGGGTNDLDDQQIKLFPNPSNGEELNLQINHPTSNQYSIKILDSRGMLVLSKNVEIDAQFSNSNITLLENEGLEKGVYLLQIAGGNQLEIHKFLVR